MWKRPYYADAHDNLPFDTFLTRQWRSYVDLPVNTQKSAHQNSLALSTTSLCMDLFARVRALSSSSATCRYRGRRYSCLSVPTWRAQQGDHRSPNINCLTGHQSDLVCSDGRYLCLVGACVDIKACDESARPALTRLGGLCSKDKSLYECVPDFSGHEGFGEGHRPVEHDRDCLPAKELCGAEGYILCLQGTRRLSSGAMYPTTSNRHANPALTVPECSYLVHADRRGHPISVMSQIGGMCRHSGRFFRCTAVSYSLAAAGDLDIPESGCLSGDESAAICHDGGYLCEHDVRLAWDPPYTFMVPLLPCHPRARDAIRAPGGGCLLDGRVQVCRQLDGLAVRTGTEPPPSPGCRSGAESWGLCDAGGFLCDEEPVLYPPGNIRHGLAGQHVPRCDLWPQAALSEIGALCRYLGQNYACVQYPGRNAKAGDRESPYVRCLSGDQSSRLCQHGKYLCEDSVIFDSYWGGRASGSGGVGPPSGPAGLPHCGLAALEKLKRGVPCIFDGHRFSCERVRYHQVQTGLEAAPFPHCRNGAESLRLCSDGMFLCLEPPECSSERDAGVALARIGGSCKRGPARFSCQDIRGESLDLGLNLDGAVNGCLSFLPRICPLSYMLCSHRLESMEPYPIFSNRHNIPRYFLPPCENGKAELSQIGGQCTHMAKTYQCIRILGHWHSENQIGDTPEHCYSYKESQYFCGTDKYLCHSSAVFNVSGNELSLFAYYHYMFNLPFIVAGALRQSSLVYQRFSEPGGFNKPPEEVYCRLPFLEDNLKSGLYLEDFTCAGLSCLFVSPCSNPGPLSPVVQFRSLAESWSLCRGSDNIFLYARPSPANGCAACACLKDDGRKNCSLNITSEHLFLDHDECKSQWQTKKEIVWNLSLFKLSGPPPCELATQKSMLKPDGVCVFDKKYYQCQVLAALVETGLEPNPSALCRTGAESWGLCENGAFLCEERPVQYPESSIRYGMKNQFIPRCDTFPKDEMQTFGALCRLKGKFYSCISISGKNETSYYQQSPYLECFSALESSFLCDEGKFLCEEGREYPWLCQKSNGTRCNSSFPLFCGVNARGVLAQNGSCYIEGQKFTCEAFFNRRPRPSSTSPFARCLSGAVSLELCPDGMFLCADPPECSKTEASSIALAKIGGVCQHLSRRYSCQNTRSLLVKIGHHSTDSSNATALCLKMWSKLVCPSGYALCSVRFPSLERYPITSNRYEILGLSVPECMDVSDLAEIGSICQHMGTNYKCISVPSRTAHVRDKEAPSKWCLNGDESVRLCTDGKFLCQDWVQQQWQIAFLNSENFPSCVMPMIASIRAAASTCSFEGVVFSCRKITGNYVYTGLEQSPGAICRNGAESWNFCVEGMFLCESIPQCAGSAGFILADIGGLCWSSNGLYHCMKMENIFGIDFNKTENCNPAEFAGVLCGHNEFLCLINTTIMRVNPIQPQSVIGTAHDSEGTNCPFDEIRKLHMIGGKCKITENYYECKPEKFVNNTLTECFGQNLSLDLCPGTKLLCISKEPNNRIKYSRCLHPKNNASSELGAGCILDGISYSCKKIPGLIASEFHYHQPIEGCKSGLESTLFCKMGRFLCESGRQYTWERDIFGTNLDNFEERKDRYGIPSVPCCLAQLLFFRNPDTLKRYPNIMAMRTAKLKDWLHFSSLKPHFLHLSCQEFLLNPE